MRLIFYIGVDKSVQRVYNVYTSIAGGDNVLNKEELAKELNISVPMVNKLMRQGMPRIKIGTAVRFELVEVVKWLKERGK